MRGSMFVRFVPLVLLGVVGAGKIVANHAPRPATAPVPVWTITERARLPVPAAKEEEAFDDYGCDCGCAEGRTCSCPDCPCGVTVSQVPNEVKELVLQRAREFLQRRKERLAATRASLAPVRFFSAPVMSFARGGC